MFPVITRWLDRIAIDAGSRSVSCPAPAASTAEDAAALTHPDYFPELPLSPRITFRQDGTFDFPSPLPSGIPRNDRVRGQLHRARGEPGPVTILVHGWNGEQGYRLLFPWLARRLRFSRVSTAMILLPYHGSRRPASGAYRNFLSGDLGHMMEATRQALGDLRALIGCLLGNGYGPIGLWGVSLGAWLTGLLACQDERVRAAALVTPVPDLDEAIHELKFCRHIRDRLREGGLSTEPLRLGARRPKQRSENLLLVESVYDLFASRESVESLWRAWGEPEIWRVRHGHISVLASPVIFRSCGWLASRLRH